MIDDLTHRITMLVGKPVNKVSRLYLSPEGYVIF